MKIIEGCMAIVVSGKLKGKSENIGKIVKVGKRIESPFEGCSKAYWEVDQPMTTVWGNVFYSQLESNLQRLDEGDDLEHNTSDVDEAIEA